MSYRELLRAEAREDYYRALTLYGAGLLAKPPSLPSILKDR